MQIEASGGYFVMGYLLGIVTVGFYLLGEVIYEAYQMKKRGK